MCIRDRENVERFNNGKTRCHHCRKLTAAQRSAKMQQRRPAWRIKVADELIAMRSDCGIAQMIVTHDFALASYVADRIAVMHRGMIVELAPAQELVSSPLHPYTKALLGSVPILGGCIPAFPDVDPECSGKLIESSPGHFVLTEV